VDVGYGEEKLCGGGVEKQMGGGKVMRGKWICEGNGFAREMDYSEL
jgi:hypothetical protein